MEDKSQYSICGEDRLWSLYNSVMTHCEYTYAEYIENWGI